MFATQAVRLACGDTRIGPITPYNAYSDLLKDYPVKVSILALLTKKQSWEVAADRDNLVGVLHAMETILVSKVPDLDFRTVWGYFVAPAGAKEEDSHHDVPAEHLLDVVASMSKPVAAVSVRLENCWTYRPDPNGEFDVFFVEIWVDRFGPVERPVKIEVTARGPISERSNERLKDILGTFAREIGHRNRSNWIDLPASSPIKLTKLRPTDVKKPPNSELGGGGELRGKSEIRRIRPSPAQSNVPGPRLAPRSYPDQNSTFLRTLTTHPLPVTVVGSIIAGGVILLLGLLINRQQDVRPVTPTTIPSSTTTAVVPAPQTSAPGGLGDLGEIGAGLESGMRERDDRTPSSTEIPTLTRSTDTPGQ